MGEIKSYKDLLIWQKGILLAEEIYSLTKSFPNDEMYGLVSQMRSCSVSVPSNIAEGYGRESKASFAQFIRISRGSLYELETQLILSNKLGFITSNLIYEKLQTLISEVSKMIMGFLKTLK